jgi:hypothetical protein
MMKVDADGKPRVGTRGYILGVRPTDPGNARRHPDAAERVVAAVQRALFHAVAVRVADPAE